MKSNIHFLTKTCVPCLKTKGSFSLLTICLFTYYDITDSFPSCGGFFICRNVWTNFLAGNLHEGYYSVYTWKNFMTRGVLHFGGPSTIFTDRGQQFESNLWSFFVARKFVSLYVIQRRTTGWNDCPTAKKMALKSN